MLSAICATYGLKQSKVLELNPGLSPNKLFVGKKIKLPGKIDLKDADVKSLAKKPAVKKQAKSSKASSYKGATKEYVVKGGDTLDKIAYSNGITIKCLKDMNGLKKNVIRIGQKLKVPASKPVVAAKAEKAKAQTVVKQEEKKEQVKTDNALAPVAEEVSKPAVNDAAATDQSVTPPPAPEQKTEPAVVAPADPVAPATDAQSSEPEAQSLKTHTVAPGEDAVSIAIRYEISPSVVLDLNNLTATDQLTPGQVLKLPANAKMQ
jgi:LysM repeat protein